MKTLRKMSRLGTTMNISNAKIWQWWGLQIGINKASVAKTPATQLHDWQQGELLSKEMEEHFLTF